MIFSTATWLELDLHLETPYLWVARYLNLKKDGSVCFISDFRELNKRIKCKPFPIPKIQDMLLKLEYATSLDLNMSYYYIELFPDSRKLGTIVLPWDKYEYLWVPMGLCNIPDVFQEKMSTLMHDLEFVRAYTDDLLAITSGSFEDHLEKLDMVLACLCEAGLKVNAKKSFFAWTELEYLVIGLPDMVSALHPRRSMQSTILLHLKPKRSLEEVSLAW